MAGIFAQIAEKRTVMETMLARAEAAAQEGHRTEKAELQAVANKGAAKAAATEDEVEEGDVEGGEDEGEGEGEGEGEDEEAGDGHEEGEAGKEGGGLLRKKKKKRFVVKRKSVVPENIPPFAPESIQVKDAVWAKLQRFEWWPSLVSQAR